MTTTAIVLISFIQPPDSMEFDHYVGKEQEQKATVWLKFFRSKSPEIPSMRFATKHRPSKTLAACPWKSGAFNICYRVKYEDGLHDIVRFAALGRAILRIEKVQNEVATMKYIRQNTSISVPEVLGSGIYWAGPYIFMPFLEGETLSELIKDRSKEGRPALNPQMSGLSEMAYVVLELSKPEFDAIGALEENESHFSVARRPLTFNMNELMVSANLPEEAFPSHTFRSATDYFEPLAMQNLLRPRLQQRDAVDSEEDCRKKYTARCLLLNVTKKLCAEHPQGSLRLYCDDFRPSNVMIDLETFRFWELLTGSLHMLHMLSLHT